MVVEHIERLLDVQLARFAVFVDAAVVVHAVSDVGRLLHFADEATAADGVYGARRDIVCLVRLDFHAVEHFFEGILFDAPPDFFFRHVAGKAEIDERAFVRAEHEPHFVLAVVALVLPGVFIARVHLDGKVFLRVDVFDEDGQLVVAGGIASCDAPADLIEVFVERLPAEDAVFDDAPSRRVGGNFPALCDAGKLPRVFLELITDLRPAPDIFLIDRF